MVDFVIRVVVDPRDAEAGQRRVRRGLDDTSRAADGVRRALVGAFAALSAGALIREISQLSDAYIALENRVRIAINGLGDVEGTLNRVAGIAVRTRAPVLQMSEVFQRASIASQELGASQQEILTVVEAVGQGLAIMGGSANTAQGALTQLSQAFGSSIVRAEEFNSIMEGAFPIAQAVARGLDEAGGSVARLRNLIIEGEVTNREFFNALLSQADSINDVFQLTTPTISQAFQVLNTGLIRASENTTRLAGPLARLIRDIGAAISVLAGIDISEVAAPQDVARIEALADTLFEASRAAALVAAGLLALFAPAILAGIAKLGAVLLVALGPVALKAATVAIGALGVALTGLVSVAIATGRDVTEVFGEIRARASGFYDAVDAVNAFEERIGGVVATLQEFGGFTQLSVDQANELGETLRGLSDEIGSRLTLQRFLFGDNEGAQQLEDQLNTVNRALERTQAVVQSGLAPTSQQIELSNEQATAFQKLLDEVHPLDAASREYAEALDLVRLATEAKVITDEHAAEIQAVLTRQFQKAVDPLSELREELERLNQLGTVPIAEREAEARHLERLAELQEQNISLTKEQEEEQRRLIRRTHEKNRAQAEEQQAYQQLEEAANGYEREQRAILEVIRQYPEFAQEGQRALEDLRLAFLDTQTDAASGFERAGIRIIRGFQDVASMVENALTSAFESAEDAIVEFVTTGKLSISSLIDSIIEDLARLAVRNFITGPIANLLFGSGISGAGGAVGGGIFGGSAGGGLLGGLGSLLSGGGGLGGLFGGGSAGGGILGGLFGGGATSANTLNGLLGTASGVPGGGGLFGSGGLSGLFGGSGGVLGSAIPLAGGSLIAASAFRAFQSLVGGQGGTPYISGHLGIRDGRVVGFSDAANRSGSNFTDDAIRPIVQAVASFLNTELGGGLEVTTRTNTAGRTGREFADLSRVLLSPTEGFGSAGGTGDIPLSQLTPDVIAENLIRQFVEVTRQDGEILDPELADELVERYREQVLGVTTDLTGVVEQIVMDVGSVATDTAAIASATAAAAQQAASAAASISSAGPVDTGLPTAATGGLFRGPGTGTSDSILARVSNGEFVVNAAATRQNLSLLRAINNSPQFQDGGLVGRRGSIASGQIDPETKTLLREMVSELRSLREQAEVFHQEDQAYSDESRYAPRRAA